MSWRRWAVLLLALVAVPACRHGARDTHAAVDVAPAAIGTAECAACGMVVREQPAPRAQIVYRDGTRAFACSIGDLVQVLAAPSPHGAAEHVYVESLPASVEPTAISASTPTTWVDAKRAFYVVGVDRPGVMGKPVLAYAERADAGRVAMHHGGRVVGFSHLSQEIMGSHEVR